MEWTYFFSVPSAFIRVHLRLHSEWLHPEPDQENENGPEDRAVELPG
jgi:hypothetical protein